MSLYVTDTHPLVWYLSGQSRKLSKRALQIFQDAAGKRTLVYVPMVVVWEVAVLLKAGRIRFRESFEQWTSQLERLGFDFVSLEMDVLHEARHLMFTKDPFDAAIVATAKVRDLPLITKDERITSSGEVEVAW